MLEEVKKALHVRNTQNDDDIQRTIDACLADLRRVGIKTEASENDPLIFSLVVNYARANYNEDGDGETWRINYERQRDAVSMAQEYNGGE